MKKNKKILPIIILGVIKNDLIFNGMKSKIVNLIMEGIFMKKKENREFFNCSNDLAFKIVFSNKKVLSLFLTSFWNKPINEDDITILNNESIGEDTEDKVVYFDVNSEVIDGNTRVILNLEMQQFKPANYNIFERLFYYFCRNKTKSLNRGENYNDSNNTKIRTECIMFTSFDVMGLGEWIYETAYQFKTKALTNDRIYYISLENYKKCPIIEIKEALECFQINDALGNLKTSLGKRAGDILMEINDDDEMRDILYKRKLEAYFNNIEINGFKNKIKEAEEKAIKANEEALKANEENKKLKDNNNAIILNLSLKGFDASEIASICNMTLDEVKNILDSKKN